MIRAFRLLAILFLPVLAGLVPAPARAAEALVAVAANFAEVAARLKQLYEADSGHEITLVVGSTGKLAAQIATGAPFDAFLAADRTRQDFLERAGLAVRGSRFTYALGRIVLWSPDPARIGPEGLAALDAGAVAHLAIANPRLAPYGRAAREALRHYGLWGRLRERLVFGQNVGQAFSLAATGNADLAIVARSYALSPRNAGAGSMWEIPASAHRPIRQDAVLLIHGRANEAARGFLAFLGAGAARAVIRAYGYEAPP